MSAMEYTMRVVLTDEEYDAISQQLAKAIDKANTTANRPWLPTEEIIDALSEYDMLNNLASKLETAWEHAPMIYNNETEC